MNKNSLVLYVLINPLCEYIVLPNRYAAETDIKIDITKNTISILLSLIIKFLLTYFSSLTKITPSATIIHT